MLKFNPDKDRLLIFIFFKLRMSSWSPRYWNEASKCNTLYVVLTMNVNVNMRNIHHVQKKMYLLETLLIHTWLIEIDISLFSHCFAVKFMKAFHHNNSDHLINFDFSGYLSCTSCLCICEIILIVVCIHLHIDKCEYTSLIRAHIFI